MSEIEALRAEVKALRDEVKLLREMVSPNFHHQPRYDPLQHFEVHWVPPTMCGAK